LSSNLEAARAIYCGAHQQLNWPINARGMVIFSQVRLQTFRLEDGDATARATVRASVLTVSLADVNTPQISTLQSDNTLLFNLTIMAV